MHETLNELRPRMLSVAYRMLGCVADAEDAVQDAFLRLHASEDITSPEGFLVRATTRRCIDRLRAQRRREKCLHPVAFEPVKQAVSLETTTLTESLRKAFVLMLERLRPAERATYILRTAFEYRFSEIAELLGKSEDHVRQIFRRASSRLLQDTPRFEPAFEKADQLAERFVIACRSGDMNSIERLFTEDEDLCSEANAEGPAQCTREPATANREWRFLSTVSRPKSYRRTLRTGSGKSI